MISRPLFILFLFSLGLVVLSAHCNVFAAASVPEKIKSSSEREVRVYLKTQYFGFYERGKLKFSGPVCTGKKGCETPKGMFRVLMKAKNYFSRKYQAAMPFSVQFTTGGHFLHVGEIRQRPSSHGCVRLSKSDAERIFCLAKIGDTVTIE